MSEINRAMTSNESRKVKFYKQDVVSLCSHKTAMILFRFWNTTKAHTSTKALIGSFGSCPAVCKFTSITPVMYGNSSSTSLSPLIRDYHYPSHSLSPGGVGDVTFSVGPGTQTGPRWLLCHGKLIAWGVSEASGGMQAPPKLHTWCSLTHIHTRVRLRCALNIMKKTSWNICCRTAMTKLWDLYLDLV